MKEGSYTHVPWMVGITDDEGAFKASALMHDKKAIKEIEDEFERLGTCSSYVITNPEFSISNWFFLENKIVFAMKIPVIWSLYGIF